jgi:hypothetical protein
MERIFPAEFEGYEMHQYSTPLESWLLPVGVVSVENVHVDCTSNMVRRAVTRDSTDRSRRNRTVDAWSCSPIDACRLLFMRLSRCEVGLYTHNFADVVEVLDERSFPQSLLLALLPFFDQMCLQSRHSLQRLSTSSTIKCRFQYFIAR